MKNFKEFRMPPITMGRDNTIVGVRDRDIPEGKYLKYSDLLLAKSRIMDKEGPNSPAMKKIDKEIAKEIKKLGLKGIWTKEENIPEGEIGDIEKLMKKGLNAKQIGKKKGYSPKRIKALANMMQLMKQLQSANEVKEGKITWTRGALSDGTMKIGIFDGDKEKALEAARNLIIFLRKNKKVKIGGDKEDSDGEPNEAIAKYSEELSKLVFDDDLLDDLEPNGKNADQSANEIVLNRLKGLGVDIK